MLTKLTIRNFKRFGASEVEIELGDAVVFVGPNNSGKTTAMQALALWYAGVSRWGEKREGSVAREGGNGVVIGRSGLVSVPVPEADMLWHRRHTRNARRVAGRQKTENIRIDILVKGAGADGPWICGLEFDYANTESFYCRLLRTDPQGRSRMPVPEQARSVRVVFLSPMSGLAAAETRLEPGAVNVRIGDGRTAEVLRNLCHRVAQEDGAGWDALAERLESLFGVRIGMPRYDPQRGELTMGYEEDGVQFDLTSSGRGLQQTLLILAYLHAYPGAVLLLEEPDAHLETLRQKNIYRLLSEAASERGNQIIVASHSEVIVNEAAERGEPVIDFADLPHWMPPAAIRQARESPAGSGSGPRRQAELFNGLSCGRREFR